MLDALKKIFYVIGVAFVLFGHLYWLSFSISCLKIGFYAGAGFYVKTFWWSVIVCILFLWSTYAWSGAYLNAIIIIKNFFKRK